MKHHIMITSTLVTLPVLLYIVGVSTDAMAAEGIAQQGEAVEPAVRPNQTTHEWKEGSVLADGWSVMEVVRHPEFLRISLMKGDARTGIEIVGGNGKRSDFCSPAYCIQPAPDATPPIEVLGAAIRLLPETTAEAYPGARTVLSTIDHATNAGERVSTFFYSYKFSLLTAILFLLMIPILAGMSRITVTGRWHRILTTITACGILVGAWMFMPKQMEPDFISILQDGTSHQNVLHLYGMGVHSSPFSREIAALMPTDDSAIKLPAVVWTNILLTMINSTLFFVIASSILKSVIPALPLTVAFYYSFTTQASARAEYPGAAATLLMLLATVCGAVINGRKRTGRMATIAGVTAIGIIAILGAGLRPELGMAGALTFFAALMLVFVPPQKTAAIQTRLTIFFGSLAANPRRAIVPALIAALFCAVVIVLEKLTEPPLSWVAGALNMFNSGLSTIPAYLTSFLSLPLLALATIGLVYTIRRPLTFLLLPVSAFLLLKLHVSAANFEFNHWLRLFTTDVPAVILLAVFGLRAISEMTWPARIHRMWKTTVITVIALSALMVPASAGNPGQYPRRNGLPDDGVFRHNPQIEVSYLLKMVNRYPNCLFATKVFKNGKYLDMHFGRSVQGTLEPVKGDFKCHMFYRSLDCNFADGPDCADMIAGTEEVDRLVFENVPYGQVTPYLNKKHRHMIQLGVYKRPPSPLPTR